MNININILTLCVPHQVALLAIISFLLLKNVKTDQRWPKNIHMYSINIYLYKCIYMYILTERVVTAVAEHRAS